MTFNRQQINNGLRAARALLNEDTWIKHQYETPDGCYCTVGAVRKVAFDWGRANPDVPDSEVAEYRFQMVARLRQALGRDADPVEMTEDGSVIAYNDDTFTEFEDIDSLFTEALA